MTFEKKMPTMGIQKNEKDNDVVEEKNAMLDSSEDQHKEVDATDNEIGKEGQNAEDDPARQNDELKKKNSELERKLLYLAAEYENHKRRSKMEIDNANKFAVSKFAMDAVNIYDVFITALKNTNIEKADKDLVNGIKMTIGEFEKMFERLQISKISPDVGSLFDHNKHEAIARVSNELEAGCIVEVVRPGYEIYGRLLRPAMVVVSSGQ